MNSSTAKTTVNKKAIWVYPDTKEEYDEKVKTRFGEMGKSTSQDSMQKELQSLFLRTHGLPIQPQSNGVVNDMSGKSTSQHETLTK